MRLNELTEAGVGKITKQNTTVDVKPGETERQAAKLFPMNKGGKPQPLHAKAAKNSTPNKLFNLGLAENISVTGTERRRLERKKGLEIGSPEWFKHWFSLPYLNEGSEIFLEGYKLRLERSKDMDVLHIVDTKSGNRTEVRGKPDYERAYDPQDPLHQLLDKIGKASNISDLINGEPVGINPKHPDGASAKAAADRAFNEDINDRKQRMFLDAMLAAMHKLVQSKGDKQSLGSYAFSIANSFGYDPRALMNLYKDRYNVSEDVTAGELNALERVVDRAFAQVGIDVEFTKHFLDRANDKRNGEPITVKELAQLFSKEIRTWGKPIAQMGPDTEAVMKDLETDINIPFVLRWNGKELEMIAKTVMRKKNFRTSNKEFPVENAPGTLLHKINWGGQNKPQQPKQNTQQQPKAKPRNRFDKLVNWYKELFSEDVSVPENIFHMKNRLLKVKTITDAMGNRPIMFRSFVYDAEPVAKIIKKVTNDTGRKIKTGSNQKQQEVLQKLGIENPTFAAIASGKYVNVNRNSLEDMEVSGMQNIFIPLSNEMYYSDTIEDLGMGRSKGGRNISLPSDFDVDKAVATYKKGWPPAGFDNEIIVDTNEYYLLNLRTFLLELTSPEIKSQIGRLKSMYGKSYERKAEENHINDILKDLFKTKITTYGDISRWIESVAVPFVDMLAANRGEPTKNTYTDYDDDDDSWLDSLDDIGKPGFAENFADFTAFNEAAGVGRVVKGVNTTVDVGPNEIIKQVKKYGNDVNKDGFPTKHLR